jgi:hypothetical protein
MVIICICLSWLLGSFDFEFYVMILLPFVATDPDTTTKITSLINLQRRIAFCGEE